MHLKFPLPTGYFPKFELTPDETLAYKELVTDIVKDTRREYEQYVRDGQRQVDSRKWKKAKSRDRLHVYKRRSEYGAAPVGLTGHGTMSHQSGSSSSGGGSFDTVRSLSETSSSLNSGLGHSVSSNASRGGNMSRSDFSQTTRSRVSSTQSSGGSSRGSATPRDQPDMPLTAVDEGATTTSSGVHKRLLEPTMLATGVMDGAVDDMVFALHEGTADEMKSMGSFSGDEMLIDAVVLHTIKLSKTTYLGLKWKLVRTPGGNRDMCFIEYVGVANDTKGHRYGFRVVESVKLRNCPPFQDNSIIRTDLSFTYLFRESGTPGIVDVYMQGAFDSSSDAVTAGGVGDSRNTMDMLLSVEKCMEIAESKKLAELVLKQSAAPPRPKGGSSQCSICRAKAGFMSSHINCQGCGAVICTKCRMKKVIVTKRSAKQKISCCKICLVNVKEKSPFEGEPINAPQPLQAIQKKQPAAASRQAPSTPVALAQTNGSNNQQETRLVAAGLSNAQIQAQAYAQAQALAHAQAQAQHAQLTHQMQELALAVPQGKQLERHRTADSFTDTDYSASMQSMQSWQSSSVSSSYSDLDDSASYSGLSYTPSPTLDSSGGAQLAIAEHRHKMPAVMESGPPQQGRHLPQYAYSDQMTTLPPQGSRHLQPQYQPQYQQQYQPQYQQQQYQPQYQPQHSGYARGAPPPPSRGQGGNQHRAGLYNQMLELQMQAERAYNLANQNAAYMQQRQ